MYHQFSAGIFSASNNLQVMFAADKNSWKKWKEGKNENNSW